MTITPSPDVPSFAAAQTGVTYGVPPAPPSGVVSRKLNGYIGFKSKMLYTVATNSQAYINRRIETSMLTDTTIKKVLKDAIFTPAHPSRWKPGFDLANMDYFVVHRGGNTPSSCTLINLVHEFTQANREASTHFIIGFNGELVQMVDLADVSFHAGTSTGPVFSTNSSGVELEGAVGEPITMAQYQTLARVLVELNAESGFLQASPGLPWETYFSLCRKKIVGHLEILPDKKTDPGYPMNYYLLISLMKQLTAYPAQDRFKKVDLLASAGAGVDALIATAENPANVAQAALNSAATYDAAGISRAMMLAIGADPSLAANSAYQNAQKSNQRAADEMAAKIRIAEMQGQKVPTLPPGGLLTMNYNSGELSGLPVRKK